MTPSRPVLRYHGGKWKLAPWIIQNLPPHRVYVEPFGGAGSVLMRKPRAYAEVYNDRWSGIVDVFRVLRDPAMSARLREMVRLTPFSRDEFVVIDEDLYARSDDPVERARLLIYRSFAGFGSNAHNLQRKTGFRSNSNRSGTTPAGDWANYADALPAFVDRLRGVVIENRPASEVMLAHDGPATLHYVDPPYVHSTRALNNPYDLKYGGYAFEMSDDEHCQLAEILRDLDGMVVLSGYRSELYDGLFANWHVIDTPALADGARERTEVLWLNASAWRALDGRPALLDMMEAAE